jgi:hypothetical protein
MRVAAIGPGTPQALKIEAARIYPLKATVDGRTRLYDEQDVHLTIIEGSWFSVTVPEHRATGYRWTLVGTSPLEGDLVVVEDRLVTPHGRPDAIGDRTVTLKIAVGAQPIQKLSLELRRPWQSVTPPAARKEIVIEVLP